ncbi:P-loop containing nucleoside triphosphate hydrolase protein, partial [Schizopora paradoxa]
MPRKLSLEEREKVREAIQTQLGDDKSPREFQVEMVVAQEEMRDAMCHAATGLGKTLIAAAPFALERNKGRVTIMVSPLIALQNEMVETFKHEYGVSAVAINSSRDCSFEVMESIVSGKFNIVLISPEKLLTEKFITNVLKNKEFEKRIYALFVDEAHCVSHWGAEFRKAYGRLGAIRAFLPRNTPVVAVSASLTPRVAKNVRTVLQFRPDHLFLNRGNNRRNVSFMVRSIHNKADSYTDLDFIVPSNLTIRTDIKKSWIYADNIHDGADIVDHIRALLPPELRDTVRPYNAMFGNEYRAKAMQEFRDGYVRILVCTDAAGMGCNIPDIDVVVQWKLPEKFSSFIQRAGRAARGEGRTGLAILLAEPSAFSVDTSQDLEDSNEVGSKTAKATHKKNHPSSAKSKKPKKLRLPKEFAELHGRYRGQRNGARDGLPQMLVDNVNIQDGTEGMHAFVQTVTCRRKVQQAVFDNPAIEDLAGPCCDICDPSLLDRARPGVGPKTVRNPKLPDSDPHPSIYASLLRWREDVRQRDFANTFVTGSSILPTEAANLLASLGSFTMKIIEGHLSKRWYYWEKYGEEL